MYCNESHSMSILFFVLKQACTHSWLITDLPIGRHYDGHPFVFLFDLTLASGLKFEAANSPGIVSSTKWSKDTMWEYNSIDQIHLFNVSRSRTSFATTKPLNESARSELFPVVIGHMRYYEPVFL